MRSLIKTSLLALAGVIATVSVVGAQKPLPLLLDFENHGCGRFPQEAYYRTQFHFVNICRGEANLQMVVTDNDGLGRERMAAVKQGNTYKGTSQMGVGYAITPTTFTIQFKGQPPSQEKVEKYVPSVTVPPSQSAAVTGTVTYLQRIALPPTAVIEVKLQDVSRADAPAITISEVRMVSGGKQVPFPFTLTYSPNQIKPNYTYAVQARILVDGQLRFINTSRYAVITQGNPSTVEVVVSPVR
jgi:uncharacterized lipoprotein YbaY